MGTAQGIVSGNVRAEMARRKISQKQLGKALGLTQAAVSKRLRDITPWSVPELEATADLLGMDVSQLLAAPAEPTAKGA